MDLQKQGAHETDGAEGNRGHETGVEVSCGTRNGGQKEVPIQLEAQERQERDKGGTKNREKKKIEQDALISLVLFEAKT